MPADGVNKKLHLSGKTAFDLHEFADSHKLASATLHPSGLWVPTMHGQDLTASSVASGLLPHTPMRVPVEFALHRREFP